MKYIETLITLDKYNMFTTHNNREEDKKFNSLHEAILYLIRR